MANEEGLSAGPTSRLSRLPPLSLFTITARVSVMAISEVEARAIVKRRLKRDSEVVRNSGYSTVEQFELI